MHNRANHIDLLIWRTLRRWRRNIRIYIVLVLGSITGIATAQPDYKFVHLDLDLVNSRIETMIQDSYGYIWIGTQGGLHRYDGSNMHVYPTSSDSTTLNVFRIECLYEDSKQRVWVTTEEGVYQYLRKKDEFRRLSMTTATGTDATPTRTEMIKEDANGRVWIGSAGDGLFYLDEAQEQLRQYMGTSNDELLHHTIVNSIEVQNNVAWLATEENGLLRIDLEGKVLKQYDAVLLNGESKALSSFRIYKLLIDHQDRIWLAFHRNGLARCNINDISKSFKWYRNDYNNVNSLYNNNVVNLTQDAHLNLWICNENGGLHLYDESIDGFHRFLPDAKDMYSISDISTKVFMEDDQGRYWVASNLAGIDIIDPYLNTFLLFQKTEDPTSLTNNVVRSFLENKEGNLWIATDGGGLNFFNRSGYSFTSYQFEPGKSSGISSNAILDLAYDSRGQIWMGSWNGSINILDTQTMQFATPYRSMKEVERIFCITRDNQGYMWVGDQRGSISLFDKEGQLVKNISQQGESNEGLQGRSIVNIMEDSKNRLWIGTEYSGVNMIVNPHSNNPSFFHFAADPSDSTAIPNVKTHHIFEDGQGQIWIGSDGGLSKFNEESMDFEVFSHFDQNRNAIKAIQEDDNGFLWLGSSKGLLRFDPATTEFRRFTAADGIQAGDFSRYAVARLSSGEMVFGGFEGFNLFDPNDLKENPHPPKMIITGLKIFNESVEIGESDTPLKESLDLVEEISLDYHQSVFTLEYAGINYTQSDRNQYAYKLEGFEEEWNYVGNLRQATYTNLDPGSYTFLVKGSNNDGVWSEAPKKLGILVIPPWWMTSYFRLGLAAFVILAVLGYIRYRTYSLIKHQEELERLVDQRTREVKKLNQELTISDKMASLGTFTAGIAHEIINPINFISGAAQKLSELFDDQRKNKKSPDPVMLDQLLSFVQTGITRTTEIINSLRKYSKGGTDSFEHADVVTVMEEALLIMSHLFRKKTVEVIRDFPNSLALDCQPGRLSQVFINLISNALDVTNAGGQIKITVRKDRKCCIIEIADNGPGMTEEVRNNLFDPFFSTKEVGKGMGLGLYIVYGIIDEHAGAITVDSSHKGSIFIINLPLRSKKVISKA